MDISKEMLDYRARNNLTQKDLAEIMGLTILGIYKIEKNRFKTEPRATTISKMQTLLDEEKRKEV